MLDKRRATEEIRGNSFISSMASILLLGIKSKKARRGTLEYLEEMR